jgi:hypothetical protein
MAYLSIEVFCSKGFRRWTGWWLPWSLVCFFDVDVADGSSVAVHSIETDADNFTL